MAFRVEQETPIECWEFLEMMHGHTTISQALKQSVYRSAWNPSLLLLVSWLNCLKCILDGD